MVGVGVGLAVELTSAVVFQGFVRLAATATTTIEAAPTREDEATAAAWGSSTGESARGCAWSARPGQAAAAEVVAAAVAVAMGVVMAAAAEAAFFSAALARRPSQWTCGTRCEPAQAMARRGRALLRFSLSPRRAKGSPAALAAVAWAVAWAVTAAAAAPLRFSAIASRAAATRVAAAVAAAVAAVAVAVAWRGAGHGGRTSRNAWAERAAPLR